MSDVHWIKLKTEMFDDERIKLIESMPEADTILIIWVKLLIQAGRTNANGYIFLNENVPFTAEMLATLFGRPLTIVRLALNTLSQFGMITIDESGSILIENWLKHQNIDGLDKVREQGRIRQVNFRERQKLLIKPINNDSNVNTKRTLNKDLDKELDTEGSVTCNVTQLKEKFDEFRKKYPGDKRGLDTEFNYFVQKHKDWQETVPTLLPSLEAQIKNRESLKVKGAFVPEWKHLKTWIYNRWWEVETKINNQQSVTTSIPECEEGQPGWM
jgi:predicted phage replisome organizer